MGTSPTTFYVPIDDGMYKSTDSGASWKIQPVGLNATSRLITDPNHPGTLYAIAAAGDADAFVAVFSADGTALRFSTYLGGANFDKINAIALGRNGRIIVAGETTSANFPVIGAAFPSYGGFQDGFVAIIDMISDDTLPRPRARSWQF